MGRLEVIFTKGIKGGCAHVKRKERNGERVAEATDKSILKAGQVT